MDLDGLILRVRIAPAPRVPKAIIPRIEEGSGIELETGAVGSCILSKAKTRRTDPEIFIESNVIPLNPKKSFDKESAFVAPDESTRLVPRKASKYVVVPLCGPTANAASVCGCVKDMTTEATVPSLGIKLVTTAPTKTGGVGGTIEPPLLEK